MTTSFNLDSLLRPDVQNMETYTPIVPFDVLSAQLGIAVEDIIKLDANENPYGPSPLVRHAIAESPFMHSYPDPESRLLCEGLSTYTNVPVENLMAGHGSDELIDIIMRLFLEPGDQIINCPPTFGMYSFDAAINSGNVVTIWRKEDFMLDISAIEAAMEHSSRVKLLFLASPNNPTGLALSKDEVKRLLNLPIVLIIDEAYAEFHTESFIEWVNEYPNLIVLRTFSKWAGLAGLRVGYGAFPLPIIEHLWKIKQPYNVNLSGQLAAQASLEDVDYLLENVQKILQTKKALAEGLAKISWLQPYPSDANFILCKVVGRDAFAVKNALAQQGILIRHYATAGLEDHVRFSVGTDKETERLLTALSTL
ncbi:MAG: histidinol-phosphate transaminase [Chloroflexota bacterium]